MYKSQQSCTLPEAAAIVNSDLSDHHYIDTGN